MSPLYLLGREIVASWPSPDPHARAYLKALHYLVDMDSLVGELGPPRWSAAFPALLQRVEPDQSLTQIKARLLRMRNELPAVRPCWPSWSPTPKER